MKIKKLWFSLVCYITAILFITYAFVGAWFLDYEVWWVTTQIISTTSSCLLLIIIGVANMPSKESKDE